MSRQIRIFDTTLRDGEQSPGASMNTEREDDHRPPTGRAEGGRHRGRLPVLLAGGLARRSAASPRRSRARSSAAWPAPSRRTSRPAGTRSSTPSSRASIPSSAPRTSTSRRSCARPRRRCSTMAVKAVTLAREPAARTWSSPPRTPCAPTATTCAEVVEAVIEAGATHRQHPGHGRLHRAVDRWPRRSRYLFEQRAEHQTRSSSRVHCHNDLGLAVGQLAGGRAGRAPGRSSAPSTASASARATPRWKRSSWPCKTRSDVFDCTHRHQHAGDRQGLAHGVRAAPASRSSRTRPSSARTPSRTRPASTSTA